MQLVAAIMLLDNYRIRSLVQQKYFKNPPFQYKTNFVETSTKLAARKCAWTIATEDVSSALVPVHV